MAHTESATSSMEFSASSQVKCFHGDMRFWLKVVIIFAMALRLYAVNTEDHQSPDTYQYARQASLLRTKGLASFRHEADHLLVDPAAAAAIPSITRTGFLALLVGWNALTNTDGIGSVAALACAMDICVVLLLAMLAMETLGTSAAVAVTLLYAVSPPALSTARHGWSDSSMALVCLANLLLALRCLQQGLQLKRSRWPLIALGVCVACSFSVKEIAFVQGCLVLLTTAVLLLYRRERSRAAILIGSAAVACAACLAWTAFAVGGLHRVFQLFGQGRDIHGLVPYTVLYQTGTAWEWFLSFWLADPVVTVLAICGFVLVLLRLRHWADQRPGLLLCGVVCGVLVILPITAHAAYNLRWITPVFAPGCILAGFALKEARSQLAKVFPSPQQLRIALAAAVMSLCVVIGLWRYDTLISQPDLQDLSLRMILTHRN